MGSVQRGFEARCHSRVCFLYVDLQAAIGLPNLWVLEYLVRRTGREI